MSADPREGFDVAVAVGDDRRRRYSDHGSS
jgi:hypothetical protein